MDSVKPALASKTIIAAIVGGLAAVSSLIGVGVSAEQQLELTNDIYMLWIAISSIVGIVSFLVTLYGRKNATAQIGGIVTPDVTKAPNPEAILAKNDPGVKLGGTF